MQGRRFNHGLVPLRNGSLGELQADQAAERGEYAQAQGFHNVPPAANAVPAMGTNAGTMPAGENQSNWGRIPFIVGTSAIKIQDTLFRKFMLLQNLSSAESLYFGFGWQPDATYSLTLGPGEGFEPFRYPTNEIWVVASGANTQGILIFGV